METAIEVSESIGSFIQMVTAFRPDEFAFTFFMDLRTVDSSASELVGREGEEGKTGKAEKKGRRKKERVRERQR